MKSLADEVSFEENGSLVKLKFCISNNQGLSDTVSFFSEDIDFELEKPLIYSNWFAEAAGLENKTLGELTFIFCSDEYLHKINLEYLNHDTYTDIITFDYSNGGIIAGDIFISIERVKENLRVRSWYRCQQ